MILASFDLMIKRYTKKFTQWLIIRVLQRKIQNDIQSVAVADSDSRRVYIGLIFINPGVKENGAYYYDLIHNSAFDLSAENCLLVPW